MGTVDQTERNYAAAQSLAKRFDPKRKPGLRLTWAADYAQIGAPRCIVQDLIEAGSLALIYGESNSGKSTLALDIALAVSRGCLWRGRRTRAGLVAYLALESANGLRRRVKAYQISHEVLDLPFFDIAEPVALLDATDVGLVLDAIREAVAKVGIEPALIVVDTLARAMPGGDENDGGAMGAVVAACDRLRKETGATVLVVHHSGKDSSKGARGHSSLRAAVDTEIEVSGQQNPRQAKVTKQRDLPSGQVLVFGVEPVEIGRDPETGEAVTACIVRHREDVATTRRAPGGKNQQALLIAIKERVRSTGSELISSIELKEIAKAQGLEHRGRYHEALDALQERGWLVPTVGGFKYAGEDL